MPLPISRPGSPDSVDGDTASQKSNSTIKSNKHDVLDATDTETGKMSIANDTDDDVSSPKSASEEIVVHCAIEDASAAEVAMPEITISAVDSNGDDTHSAEPTSDETDPGSRGEFEEVKCKCIHHSCLLLPILSNFHCP